MAPMHSAIIFDLDGTLVDTALDLTQALNAVLAQAGRAPVPLERIRDIIGDGARRMVERGFAEGGAALDAGELDRRTAAFFDHYRAHLSDLSRPFPGVPETLETLAAEGAIMGVCTNKPADPSRRILDDLDLSRFFGAIVGSDSVAVRKPDPEHLAATIRALGAAPAQAVMIGDSDIDSYGPQPRRAGDRGRLRLHLDPRRRARRRRGDRALRRSPTSDRGAGLTGRERRP